MAPPNPRNRRCTRGELTRHGLPQCLRCYVEGIRREAREDGISYGRALGEIATLERLHRAGRLLPEGARPEPRAVSGVVFDQQRANLIAEFTEGRPAELYQGESIHRPDGSHLYL